MTIERLSQLQKEHHQKLMEERKQSKEITVRDKDGNKRVIVITPEMMKSRHMWEW